MLSFRRVRLLLVYNYLPTHLGGIETAIDALACEFARRGHEVTAVGARIEGLPSRPKPTAYEIIAVPAGNPLERRLGVPLPFFSPTLFPVLAKEVARSDVVHGHGFLAPATFAALALARLRGDKGPLRLLTEHVGHVRYKSRVLDHAEGAAIQTLGRGSVALAETVIVCSARVADELRRLHARTPVAWIANGVDVRRYCPPSAEERRLLRRERGWDSRPRVLFVGRFVAKKGIGLAVAAAREGRGAFELVAVGPGASPGSDHPHVEILGARPSEEVAALYRACDAFLLPSSGEGFPLSALEAVASGLPAVLCEDPAYANYVDQAGGAIRMVRPTPDLIARELIALLSNGSELAAVRKDGPLRAAEAFSWARVADEHEALYERLRLARRHARRERDPRSFE